MPQKLTMEFDPPLDVCPFCETDRVTSYDSDYLGRNISRCGDCGVKFLNPQYTDDYLTAFYGQYLDELSERGQVEQRMVREKRIEYVSVYMGMVERYGTKGSFLCVGCGDGLEMELARDRGWDSQGYDVDPEWTSEVAERTGLEVRCGDFLEIDYAPESFDCIFMHHVIEHPKNPKDYLVRILELLRPGGVLFLATPNIGSFSGVYKTLLGKAKLKKRRGKHYDAWHHLFYYSPAVMKRILRATGYDVLYSRSGAEFRPKRSRVVQRMILNWNLGPLKSTFVMIACKPAD